MGQTLGMVEEFYTAVVQATIHLMETRVGRPVTRTKKVIIPTVVGIPDLYPQGSPCGQEHVPKVQLVGPLGVVIIPYCIGPKLLATKEDLQIGISGCEVVSPQTLCLEIGHHQTGQAPVAWTAVLVGDLRIVAYALARVTSTLMLAWPAGPVTVSPASPAHHIMADSPSQCLALRVQFFQQHVQGLQAVVHQTRPAGQ